MNRPAPVLIKAVAVVLILVMALGLSSCFRYQSLDGVKNTWREISVDQFQRGVTTQAEILEMLGPPSQMIALGDQTVFYYLMQKKAGSGKVFILWNDAREETRYDRAVFFFSEAGVLEEFSVSNEKVEKP